MPYEQSFLTMEYHYKVYYSDNHDFFLYTAVEILLVQTIAN